MSTPKFIVGSVEYLKAEVGLTSPAPGEVIEDSETVEIKVNGTWHSAAWTGTPAAKRIARTLVDFSAVPAGDHNIYVRLTDSPETPILSAGRIRVETEKAS